MTITLSIPEPTPTLNQWQRMHWAQRRKLCERFAWLLKLGNPKKQGKEISHCQIVIYRMSPGARPDWDNLYGGFKPLLDCLVMPTKSHPHGLGWIVDDNPACIDQLIGVSIDTRKAGKITGTKIVINEI